MRALLLAAGFGTRLRPLTDNVPKCLVPIRGIALIDYWFDLLLANDKIDRVLVNTHHLAGQVYTHIQHSPWRAQVDVAQESILLGTAGTILRNKDYFQHSAFLVAHADNLTRFDLTALQSRHHHRPPGCAFTMLTFETDMPRACGIVECDESGVVQRFHEKVATPPGTTANGAVYILEPEIIEFIAKLDKVIVDFSTEVIPAFLGRIATFHNLHYHRDIGTPASLASAEVEF